MDRQIYRIQIRSLRNCLEHLRTLDLDQMATKCVEHGSLSDCALIDQARAFLTTLPTDHL
jgi:hypothetical protein